MVSYKEDMEERQEAKHSPWRMILIIVHMLVLAATLAFNYMAVPMFSVPGLYESDTETISDLYYTKITPAGWTFTIWAVIYLWQIVHAVYSLTLLCRYGANGQYLYVSPGHIHYSFYIAYILNNCANIAWMFTFDRSAARSDFLYIAMALLFMIAFTIYICGVLICKYLAQAGAYLESTGNSKEIWMTRLLVLNGLAFYGTWCTIASLLNFSIVLQYKEGVDSYISAWICLGILTAELLLWFVLETFVFDRHLRYCFSQYIVLLIALSGLQYAHFQSSSPEAYTLYVMFLLSLSGLLGLVKLVLMIVKGLRNPILYNNTITPTTKDLESI